MTDWLEDLREAKKRAIDESKTVLPLDAAGDELLRTGQQRIGDLLQATQVEAQLSQFMDEIIRGHPWFPDSSLTRTVISIAANSPESKELSPWSGPVKGNALPYPLQLSNGRYITRIEWNLGLAYRAPQRHLLQMLAIPIAFSAQVAQVNGENLAEPTAEGMQAALKNSFEQVIKAAQTRHSSAQRRQRPWYKRLWSRLNYQGRAIRLLLVLALIAAALFIGWLSMNANQILPNRPRRMVEMQRSVGVTYEFYVDG